MLLFFIFDIAIYPIRLSDGTDSSGCVEIFFNGRWGTVCNENFDKLDGQVVCSQLNQGRISRIANPMEFPVGTNDQPIWLDEVQCVGDERWLSACLHPGYGDNDCLHSEDVAVVCSGEYLTSQISSIKLSIFLQESKQNYQFKEYDYLAEETLDQEGLKSESMMSGLRSVQTYETLIVH